MMTGEFFPISSENADCWRWVSNFAQMYLNTALNSPNVLGSIHILCNKDFGGFDPPPRVMQSSCSLDPPPGLLRNMWMLPKGMRIWFGGYRNSTYARASVRKFYRHTIRIGVRAPAREKFIDTLYGLAREKFIYSLHGFVGPYRKQIDVLDEHSWPAHEFICLL